MSPRNTIQRQGLSESSRKGGRDSRRGFPSTYLQNFSLPVSKCAPAVSPVHRNQPPPAVLLPHGHRRALLRDRPLPGPQPQRAAAAGVYTCGHELTEEDWGKIQTQVGCARDRAASGSAVLLGGAPTRRGGPGLCPQHVGPQDLHHPLWGERQGP